MIKHLKFSILLLALLTQSITQAQITVGPSDEQMKRAKSSAAKVTSDITEQAEKLGAAADEQVNKALYARFLQRHYDRSKKYSLLLLYRALKYDFEKAHELDQYIDHRYPDDAWAQNLTRGFAVIVDGALISAIGLGAIQDVLGLPMRSSFGAFSKAWNSSPQSWGRLWSIPKTFLYAGREIAVTALSVVGKTCLVYLLADGGYVLIMSPETYQARYQNILESIQDLELELASKSSDEMQKEKSAPQTLANKK